MVESTRTRWFRDIETADVTDMVRAQARHRPDAVACVVTGRSGPDEVHTYGDLDARARAVAARLARSAAPGDRALVLHPAGIDFVAGFLGCLYAGVVAVPAPYSPAAGGLERAVGRLDVLCRSARPAVTLTTGEVAALCGPAETAQLGEVVETAAIPAAGAAGWTGATVGRGRIALLQYTSGSTSDPKGVVVTHANLLHNIGCIEDTFAGWRAPRPIEDTVAVSWLPHFHDMGLVTMLAPLTAGGTSVLLSPVSFLRDPVSWLDAVTRFGGHFSAAPNFAYELCVEKISDREKDRLDLSSWEVALNGAEPVRPETLERFARAFSACGFRAEAFAPCYGLAESTVFVTGGRRPDEDRSLRLDRTALQRDGIAAAPRDASSAVAIASCGRPPAGTEVRVVDPERLVQPGPDRVGEVWVAGPSVAAGYWELPAETEATFGARLPDLDGQFLRTGDLGFLRDGQLFLVGRLKDLVILDGRNLHPQDIELTVQRSHPALAAQRCAAFALADDASDKVVVVAELRPGRRPATPAVGVPLPRGLVDAAEVVAAVRARVRDEHDVGLAEVALLRPGALPVTTSGKVRRRRSRELWLSAGLRTW